MKNLRSLLLTMGFLLIAAGTVHGKGVQIDPEVILTPNVFSAGEESASLACIFNSNPTSNANILQGDVFRLRVGDAAGTALPTGSVFVYSAVLQPTDFTIAAGVTPNEMFINYVGITKKFGPGESFCIEIVLQAVNSVGPFEIIVDPPSLPSVKKRYFRDRSYTVMTK